MAIGNYSFWLYNNDGSGILLQQVNIPQSIFNIDGNNVVVGGTVVWTYTGNKIFKGLATTPNATDAVYVSGDIIELTEYGLDVFYVVEAEPTPTDTVTIEYNGSVIASLKAGQTATLPCKDKPMHTDVVVSVPEGLGAGEVVEEWDGSYTISGGTISFTVAGTSYEAEDGMTWEQWVNSSYNTAGFFGHLLDGVVCVGIRAGSGGNGYGVAYNDAFVPIADLIVEGREYTEKYGSHSGGSAN